MTLRGGPQLAVVVAFVFSVHLLWCCAAATGGSMRSLGLDLQCHACLCVRPSPASHFAEGQELITPCADLPGVMLFCVLNPAKSDRTEKASWWMLLVS